MVFNPSFLQKTTRSRTRLKGCCRYSGAPRPFAQPCRVCYASDPRRIDWRVCVSRSWLLWIIDLLTRVWYETAKGLCFVLFLGGKTRKRWMEEEKKKAPASNFVNRWYGFIRLPGQSSCFSFPLNASSPCSYLECLRGVCIANAFSA